MTGRPRVALIGGAGFIGQAVAAKLQPTADVVVVDKFPRSGGWAVDLTAADVEERLLRPLDGVAAVVHLASRVDPATPAERDAMRRLHFEGTRAVARAANRAGVEKLVLVSSATVYGAWPDHPVPLTEEAPLRPNPGFAYAEDKAAQEQIAEAERGAMLLSVARPAIVYGPHAKNYLTEILRWAPVLPAVDGHRPPLQFVHVQDVARALMHLVLSSLPGAFNVGPADWLSFDEVARLRGRRVVSVPHRLVAPMLERLSRVLPSHLRAPATMLPLLMHPFVLSSDKLRRTGWTPQLSSQAALQSIG